MANRRSPAELCREVVARLGVLGLVFLGSLLLFLALRFIGSNGFIQFLVALVVAATGIPFLIRLVRRVSRDSLWSLRNRLLMVYTLLGFLPIVLILVLVGLSLWALTSELAISLATSELDRRLHGMQSAAEVLLKTPIETRTYAGPEIVDYFKVYYPGIRLYATDSTGTHGYPAGSPPLDLPSGWKDSTGLIQHDGKFYEWAHLSRPSCVVTAVAPVTDEQIADLVPNLGQITLSELDHGHEKDGSGGAKIDTSRLSRNPDYEIANGKVIPKSPGSRLANPAIHNAGHLPPPMNRLDVDVDWFAFYPHYDWNDPNHKHSALLLVRSRPSAVFSAIFTGNDQFRTALFGIMIGVALLFLVVEIVAVFFGISLSRRITSSINELYEGTRRVIYGDFRHRIPVRGTDQLCELTSSFNQMTGNLERLLSVEKEKERLQAELEIAREVQTQLYPRSTPPSRGLRLTVHCEPARVVSGDYYDYECVTAEKIAFAVGDVAGKGISAALLMATVQAALRAQISAGLSNQNGAHGSLASARLVSELNKQLYAHTAPEKYATFFFAMYDDATGTLTYTNAGHVPPVLIRNGEAVTLDINGTVVGAFPFSQYDESKIDLVPGDLLVCYTDGITEPENAYGEMFGEDRLLDLVKRSADEEDHVIIKKVIEAVRTWHSASELPDDMTLLLARRLEHAA